MNTAPGAMKSLSQIKRELLQMGPPSQPPPVSRAGPGPQQRIVRLVHANRQPPRPQSVTPMPHLTLQNERAIQQQRAMPPPPPRPVPPPRAPTPVRMPRQPPATPRSAPTRAGSQPPQDQLQVPQTVVPAEKNRSTARKTGQFLYDCCRF